LKQKNNDGATAFRKGAFIWLIIAALGTIVLWQFSWGNYFLYPFTIMATWFHEMGHGLTALVLGGNFQKLIIYANGSGLAFYGGNMVFGDMGRAVVAAGGPLGPAFAGAVFILAGRRNSTAHYCLILLGIILFVSAFIWVRSIVGLTSMGLSGAIILLIALKAAHGFKNFSIQFLGVQACVSVYRQLGYLFTHSVVIGGKPMLSDTGQMADYLFFPYWVWGLTLAGLSLLILLVSLWIAYR
jgi:hypothetical protein